MYGYFYEWLLRISSKILLFRCLALTTRIIDAFSKNIRLLMYSSKNRVDFNWYGLSDDKIEDLFEEQPQSPKEQSLSFLSISSKNTKI